MIRWFKDIGDQDFTLVGGKALNLAEMYNNGIPVPNGFVVLSTAYDTYVTENGCKEIIDGLLVSPLAKEAQSVAIQKLFQAEKLQGELRDSILSGFREFATARVAVRSSATVEDLPGLSFAGQYSSFLNVSEEDLIEKIILCWRSLWHVRAMDYREKNLVTEAFSHCVVVQEMVDARVSGVLFTANPMNGIRHQMVVNASWGLGEAIVSGEVNPDQYVVNRRTGEQVTATLNKKHLMYRYGKKGIEKTEVHGKQANQSCLDKKMLEELQREMEKVETYFTKPQDMEFAFDQQGGLKILQSRDITTLYPIESLTQDGKLRPYMSASTVLLGVREPFTPLGYDLMSHMFPTIINVMTARKRKPLSNGFVSYAGGRIYVDMSYLFSNRFIAKQFAGAFSGNDLPLKGVMDQLLKDYGKTLRRQGIHFRLPLGVFRYGLQMAFGMIRILRIPHEDRYQAMIMEGDLWYQGILGSYEQANTTRERLDFAHEALITAFRLSQAQAMYCLDANNYIRIEKVLKKHFGNTYKVETLVQSLDGCITQTMTMDLNRYAKACAEEAKEPSAEDPEFKDILSKYGRRATVELDFGTERWSEDPGYLLGLVKDFMKDGMYERNMEDHRKKQSEALAMIDEVTEQLRGKFGDRQADKFKTYLTNYRYGAAMREYPKYDIVRFLALARKSVQVIGERLVEEGRLQEKNDIFFLRREQILKGGDYKTMVDEAKALYQKEMKRHLIPRMLLNNGHTYYNGDKPDPNSKVLKGQPLSAGIYEGVIKVVHDPRHANLKEGDIMVTETTNPSWTPLFATAGALIMEYGGPMSHGGIVAREYGIPAVVGISSAKAGLKDGQRVRVNGETGSIELL